MRCPTLNQLPPPPPDKIGWPWTEETTPLPPTLPSGDPWPRISIVTPSYNQGQFLEETIRSVLLQGYPNLEYIIIDGGSTDESVEIIKTYEPWLAYWVSEKDNGQSHALNKGFEKATGEIMAWINSDDYYLPFAFSQATEKLFTSKKQWIIGNLIIKDFDSEKILECKTPLKTKYMECFNSSYSLDFRFNQQSSFWGSSFWQKNGKFEEKLHFAFDSEWFFRSILRGERPLLVEDTWAVFRMQNNSKTNQYILKFRLETAMFLMKFLRNGKLKPIPTLRLSFHFFLRFIRGTVSEEYSKWKNFAKLKHKNL